MTVIAQDDHLTAGAWAACDVIICASLLPVRVISRLQHPDIGAN